jgi:hypothetical protein
MSSLSGQKAELKSVVLWATGLTVLILFGLLVWPTLYRYDHMDLGEGRSLPVRQNRVTGETEILYPNGWKITSHSEASHQTNRDLTPEEISKVTVTPELEGVGGSSGWSSIKANTYNGLSELAVYEITIQVTVLDPNGQSIVDARPYRMMGEFGSVASPLRSTWFNVPLGFIIHSKDKWSWRLVGAKGRQP